MVLLVVCCLLIALNVVHELSHDQFHKNADRIHRLVYDIKMDEQESKGTCTPSAMAKALENDFPEIEKTARLNPYFQDAGNNYVRSQGTSQSSFEEKFVYADPSFFEIFDLPLIQGVIGLKEPFKVVITERKAQKLFRDENPIGKVLILNDDVESSYEITGVIKNIPNNSHFDFDYFMSMSTLNNSTENDWIMNAYFTYALLQPTANPQALEQKFLETAKQYIGPQFKSRLNMDYETLMASGDRYDMKLQALGNIYLHSQGFNPHLGKVGDIRYVRLFAAVAIFIRKFKLHSERVKIKQLVQ